MLEPARIRIGLAAICCGALVLVHAPRAQAQQSNVDFTITGTSTVRGWTCSAKGVIAPSSGTASTQPVPGVQGGVPTATVTIPLKAFSCPNEEMLQHLLEAMKAEKFGEIVYKLEKYEVVGGQGQATGTMTITGNSQPVSFPVALKSSAEGVELEGETRLDMTKFGVDPPVVMMGLMKVGPQVRIQFKGRARR